MRARRAAQREGRGEGGGESGSAGLFGLGVVPVGREGGAGLLSGTQAAIAVKIFGTDLYRLRVLEKDIRAVVESQVTLPPGYYVQ